MYMKTIYIYFFAAVVFLILDGLWLGFIANNLYQEALGSVINMAFYPLAAVIFYLLYIGGLLYFVVLSSIRERDTKKALMNGALLGGLCYATYDMTNLATIEHWPVTVVVVDILWGMFITGITCGVTTWVFIKWIK